MKLARFQCLVYCNKIYIKIHFHHCREIPVEGTRNFRTTLLWSSIHSWCELRYQVSFEARYRITFSTMTEEHRINIKSSNFAKVPCPQPFLNCRISSSNSETLFLAVHGLISFSKIHGQDFSLKISRPNLLSPFWRIYFKSYTAVFFHGTSVKYSAFFHKMKFNKVTSNSMTQDATSSSSSIWMIDFKDLTNFFPYVSKLSY